MAASVTASHEIWSFELYVKVFGGEIYQHFLGNYDQVQPADPIIVSAFPAAGFDSYATVGRWSSPCVPTEDDYREYYKGPLHWQKTGVHAWVNNTEIDPPPFDFTTAQLTFVPTQAEFNHQWLVRFYEASADAPAIDHIFTSPNMTSPFGGDMNLDFKVDAADLALWTSNFEQSASPPFDFAPGLVVDFDDDGDTDDFDGAILLSNFGRTNATPEQGDANKSGTVNSDDYKMFFHYNFGHKWNPADVDQDRDVDGADFLQWQRRVGGGFPDPPPQVAAPVPEPASLLLAALTGLGLVARRGAPR